MINRAVVREGRPYPPASVAELEILPDVPAALARLHEAGFRLVVVTNQPDVARGTQQRAVIDAMHALLARTLPIDEFRVCPHDDADDCDCRKPKAGMLRDAARDGALDLADSFMVGDRWRDIDAGRAAGCRTVFIDCHYAERRPERADATVSSLSEAADWILRADAPFSLVVPVYNEAPILMDSLTRMVAAFDGLGRDYEIFVCENGSTDDTPRLTRDLARIHANVRAAFLPAPNYGLALNHGIAACRHELVVMANIDFWSEDFVRRALPLLDRGADMVLGSKVMAGSQDERPWLRRAITRSFNAFLRRAFGFTGTDTHGLKALRKTSLAPIAGECVTDRSFFDTELVLRAERHRLRIVEIPVEVREIRQPDYWSIVRRIPETFSNLVRLMRELRRDGADIAREGSPAPPKKSENS